MSLQNNYIETRNISIIQLKYLIKNEIIPFEKVSSYRTHYP